MVKAFLGEQMVLRFTAPSKTVACVVASLLQPIRTDCNLSCKWEDKKEWKEDVAFNRHPLIAAIHRGVFAVIRVMRIPFR